MACVEYKQHFLTRSSSSDIDNKKQLMAETQKDNVCENSFMPSYAYAL